MCKVSYIMRDFPDCNLPMRRMGEDCGVTFEKPDLVVTDLYNFGCYDICIQRVLSIYVILIFDTFEFNNIPSHVNQTSISHDSHMYASDKIRIGFRTLQGPNELPPQIRPERN